MGQIISYNGIIIYYNPGDHNPRHLHVYAGDEEFTISFVERLIDGEALSSTLVFHPPASGSVYVRGGEDAAGGVGDSMALAR